MIDRRYACPFWGRFSTRFSVTFAAFIFGLISTALHPVAADTGTHRAGTPNEVDAQVQAAQRLGQAIFTLAAQVRVADGPQRAAVMQRLLNQAQERQTLLAALIVDHPAEVLKAALPTRLAARMPAEVQQFIEQKFDAEGDLTVMHVDAEASGKSRYLYLLETPSGQHLSLHFAGKATGHLTGTRVRVSGVLFDGVSVDDTSETDGALALQGGASGGLTLLAAGGDGGAGGPASATAITPAPNTFGDQLTAVLLVNFQDDPANKPWTAQETRDLVFGTVSDFFFENSYQQTWLSGDVHGWYTLGINSTCGTTSIEQAANEIAAQQGLNLAAYNRIIYLFPDTGCSFAGLATVGGSPSKSFIAGGFNLRVIGHELSHNFGLYHSHGLNCSGGVIGADCMHLEYGDRLDILGVRELHINAFQKERLGWLNYGNSPTITTIDADGAYHIPPYEVAGTGSLALKIFRDIDPNIGQPRWLYLEYRQAMGFDRFMLETPYLNVDNVLNGVVFHLGTEGNDIQAQSASYLLDMTPDTSSNAFLDLDDPALTIGQVYSDPVSGVTVATDWTDGAGATVTVSFGGQTCVRADPIISLSPVETQWVPPGTPVTMTASVTNSDGSACPAINFDLSASVPDGWSVAFTEATLLLGAGATAVADVTIISPTTTTNGFYDLLVTAQNAVDATYRSSATATYVVSADTANAAPTAVDDSTSTPEATPVVVNVLANDFDPDSDPLTVRNADQGSQGKVTLNADGTVTYTPNRRAKGMDSFAYSVTDGAATATAVVTVSIQKVTGGGAGKGRNK